MRPVLLAALLGACAAPRAAGPEPAGVAAVAPGDTCEILPEAEPERPAYAWRLARRLREAGLGKEKWPRRWDLPKAEECYDVANLWFGGTGCATCTDVLVDLADPRVFWVRVTGGIAGIREYLGPAEIVDDSGPLVFRVGE